MIRGCQKALEARKGYFACQPSVFTPGLQDLSPELPVQCSLAHGRSRDWCPARAGPGHGSRLAPVPREPHCHPVPLKLLGCPVGSPPPAAKTQPLLEELVCWSVEWVADYAILRASRAR